MHFCKSVWKLPYTRLRRSSSIAATSSTMACLRSWIVMIRLQNTRSFRNPDRKNSGTVSSGDRACQAMSPKLRTQVTRCCTFQRSIATDHMKWRPLLHRSPSRQSRQAIAPAQYSNLKCVSRLGATLCNTNEFRQPTNVHYPPPPKKTDIRLTWLLCLYVTPAVLSAKWSYVCRKFITNIWII